MEPFARLLSKHIKQLGISDAELARAIGVRRQTIFRWREGLTARPRHRDDALLLARKLRLTPQERDELLLSAGFAPESPAEAGNQLSAAPQLPAQHKTEAATGDGEAPAVSLWRRYAKVWISVLLAVTLAGVTTAAIAFIQPTSPMPAATPLPTQTPAPKINISPAKTDETLILVTKFVNYAGKTQGYNVAGRLIEALKEEIAAGNLKNIRVELWPEEIDLNRYALQAGRAVSATLVIYGEYDAGRILLRFAQPAAENALTPDNLLRQVDDLPALSAIINSELPQQTRLLALMALGKIYLDKGEGERALQVFQQAEQNPAAGTQSLGALNFYLGVAYQNSQPPQLDKAIAAYTLALDVNPGLLSALLNRSAAYQTRQHPGDFDLSAGGKYVEGVKRIPVHAASLQTPGDLSLALDDANQAIKLSPNWPAAYNNRAAILMSMATPQALKLAKKDLDKAIALDAALTSARINRAIFQFKQGQPVEVWKEDLDEVLRLEPDRPAALNMLCWGYAVEEQPKLALPYCEKAVSLDPRPAYIDSRGLANALLGNTQQAIDDFEVFIAWLAEQPGAEQGALRQRQAWVKALKAGENPFTPAVMEALRH